QGSDHN
ncbi:hypothetical protein CEXT_59941, partial [Caerostris extrusa]